MNLTIANISNAVSDDDLASAVAAINKQVAGPFSREWGVSTVLTATQLHLSGDKAPLQTATEAVIYVGEKSQDPAAGAKQLNAYHAEIYTTHVPVGFVYLDVCKLNKEPWTCALSHEVLEMLVDPSGTLCVSGPPPANSGFNGYVAYALEVCDPTQGENYPIDGVCVCNYVNKAYFGLLGPAKTTNYLGTALASFGVRPKGTIAYIGGGESQTIDGDSVDNRRLKARKLLTPYRRTARRMARLKGS